MTHVLTFYFPLVHTVSPGEAVGRLLKASGAPETFVPQNEACALSELLLSILPPWFVMRAELGTMYVLTGTSNPEAVASKQEQKALMVRLNPLVYLFCI